MQTKNSNPTPRVQEQPEQFDEFTGGYDMTDHNRAAKRISADIWKVPQPVEPDPMAVCKELVRLWDAGIRPQVVQGMLCEERDFVQLCSIARAAIARATR
jgi:hypothetical protein